MRTVLSYCHTCHWWQVPVSSVFGTWPLHYCIRLFPHLKFGLFQFVAMSTQVRDALTFQNSYRVTNEPSVPPCCSPTVKLLESLTPYRT
jgi:hypothetical protein